MEGGNDQTKGTTAQEQGCQSADVVANQDNQKSNHHEDRGEGKMCSGKCTEYLLSSIQYASYILCPTGPMKEKKKLQYPPFKLAHIFCMIP